MRTFSAILRPRARLIGAAGLAGVLVLGFASCRTLPDPQTLPPVAQTPSEDVSEPVEVEAPLDPELDESRLEVLRVTERPTDLVVRVGLQTDRSRVDFECCGPLSVGWEGKEFLEGTRLTARADPRRATAPVFHLQVAALRDGEQARATVERLSGLTGFGGSTLLDAESGLHKVRVGPFAVRAEAEAAKRTLSQHGVDGAWVLTEGGDLEDPAIEVRSGGHALRVPGRWLAITGSPEAGIRVAGTRYRGRILLFLNDRGSLNVIDELSIEQYLRGVVPKELGPDLYPQLEALKAQTVAARTYTVRNLGEFSSEGFDICATPRCQVYGGMEVEHPLTDRAIQETVGEVLLWSDEPIDALYSATCGGHTEDVGTVFPLKRDEVYLKGVPCLEHGRSRLRGMAPPEDYPVVLLHRELRLKGDAPEILGARLAGLRRLAGLSSDTVEGLHDRSRSAIERYWQALGGEVTELPFGADSERLDETLEDEFLWRVALEIGAFHHATATFAASDGEELAVRLSSGTDLRLPLDARVVVARRDDGGLESDELVLAPGDTLEVIRRGGHWVAVVQDVPRPRVQFDRVSRWNQWQRFRTDLQLRDSVAEQVPGFQFASFEPLERGVSGRVGRLKLTGVDGREEILEGLAVRWALDLPDTRFTARRSRPAGKGPGWLFSGQGWGHGVGMCQIGAYGMAQRGNPYRSILSHYYAGATLGRVSAVVRRVQQQAR